MDDTVLCLQAWNKVSVYCDINGLNDCVRLQLFVHLDDCVFTDFPFNEAIFMSR